MQQGLGPRGSGAGSPVPSWRATGAADGAAARPRPFPDAGRRNHKRPASRDGSLPQPQGLPDASPRQVLPEARGPSSRPVPQGRPELRAGQVPPVRRPGCRQLRSCPLRWAPHAPDVPGPRVGAGRLSGPRFPSPVRDGLSVRRAFPAGAGRNFRAAGRAQARERVRCCRQRRSFPPGSRVHGRGSPGPGPGTAWPMSRGGRGLPSCLS